MTTQTDLMTLARMAALIDEVKGRDTGSGACTLARVNGHLVRVDTVHGFRNMGASRKPRIRWRVDGKPVAAAALIATVNAH